MSMAQSWHEIKAHHELDRAVDLCYHPQAFSNEPARIEYLFELYNEYTAPLLKRTGKRNETNSKCEEIREDLDNPHNNNFKNRINK